MTKEVCDISTVNVEIAHTAACVFFLLYTRVFCPRMSHNCEMGMRWTSGQPWGQKQVLHATTFFPSHKKQTTLHLQMMPGDGLPSHICCDCVAKLESAYKFKLQVEEADSVLRERMDSVAGLNDVKEEFFFGDVVNVGLAAHGHVVEESLLLKQHMDLLDDRKITEDVDDELQRAVKKPVVTDEMETEEAGCGGEMELQLGEIDDQQQEIGMQGDDDERHEESFETQELQDMMLDEMGDEDGRMQELMQAQQQHLAMLEHDYVGEVVQRACGVAVADGGDAMGLRVS